MPRVGELDGHCLYACPRWLGLLERGGRIPARYITGPPGGQPVGLLPYHCVVPTRNPAYSVAHLTRGLPEGVGRRGLSYAGPLSAYQCEIPTVTGTDAGQASTTLVRVAQAESVAAGRPLAVPYLTSRAARRLPAELRSQLLLEDLECWFVSPAGSLAEHLDRLPRKHRQNWNRDLRLFRQAGLIDAVEPLRDCLADVARLVGHTAAKYGLSHDEPGLVAHLTTIEEAFGADAVVFTARTGRRLVGAALGVFHEGTLYLRMTGFDRDATRRASAYFQLLYYMPLEYRRQRPHTRVHHGTGLLLTKHRHGAEIVPLWTLLLHPAVPGQDIAGINRERFAALTSDLPADLAARLACAVFAATSEGSGHAR